MLEGGLNYIHLASLDNKYVSLIIRYVTKDGVFVRVSISVIKHYDQKQLGEERVYFGFQF